jgi:hypothetical protein
MATHKKISLPNFQKDTPAFFSPLVGLLSVPYQIAKRLAFALFDQHKCHTYELTEAGIVGIGNEGTVLLERNTVEQYVLSCLTDLTMRHLPDELHNLVLGHNESIFNQEKSRKAEEAAAEEAARERKREEVFSKLSDHRRNISRLNDLIKESQYNIKDAELSLESHNRYVPPDGLLESPQERKGMHDAITARLKDLQTRYKQQQKDLAEAESKLLTAEKEYSRITGKPIFD